jgi:hypothetical protein
VPGAPSTTATPLPGSHPWEDPDPHRAHPHDPAPGRPLMRRGRPVFMERSGRRRRLLRGTALLLACACAGYILVYLATVAAALQPPADTQPPRIGERAAE